LHQDAIANALAGIFFHPYGRGAFDELEIHWSQLAGGTASTTFRIRGGTNAADTITFNGQTSARKLGGVSNSLLRVKEIAT